MKREEIKVGQDYLLSTSPDWAHGHYRNERVRVHDVGFWTNSRFSNWSGKAASGETLDLRGIGPSRLATGGILVEYLNRGGETLDKTSLRYRRFAVKEPRYIRAPWEEADALIQKNVAARDKAREEADRRSREASRRKETVCETLKGLGVDVSPGTYDTVKIRLADAEALIERLRHSVSVEEFRTEEGAL